MNIYFDLDGTILDISERYYLIYKKVMEEFNANFLLKDKYWQLKREKTSVAKILKETSKNIGKVQYQKRGAQLIEDKRFLKYDKTFPEVYKVLDDFKKKHRLILVTLRRFLENLNWELVRLKLTPYFDTLLICQEGKPNWQAKANLIKNDLNFSKKDSIVIGDTEIDILAAQQLQIKSIAISRGMRTKEFLLRFKPDFIVDSLLEIKDI